MIWFRRAAEVLGLPFPPRWAWVLFFYSLHTILVSQNVQEISTILTTEKASRIICSVPLVYPDNTVLFLRLNIQFDIFFTIFTAINKPKSNSLSSMPGHIQKQYSINNKNSGNFIELLHCIYEIQPVHKLVKSEKVKIKTNASVSLWQTRF